MRQLNLKRISCFSIIVPAVRSCHRYSQKRSRVSPLGVASNATARALRLTFDEANPFIIELLNVQARS